MFIPNQVCYFHIEYVIPTVIVHGALKKFRTPFVYVAHDHII